MTTTAKNNRCKQMAGVFLLSLFVALFNLEHGVAAPVSAAKPTKSEVITKLKGVLGRQSQEIQTIDEAMRKRLSESTSLTIKAQDARLADRKVLRLSGQIDELAGRRTEYIARREFLNDLIFSVDTKWSGDALNVFFEHLFLDMALTDLTDPKSDSRLWKFLVYLSVTVREVPEPREDVIGVIENYLNFSSVLDPKTPALFLESRSYSNGSLSYMARPVSRDRVGDLVESRLRALKKVDTTDGKAPADIELRLSPIAPPPPPPAEPAGSVSGTTGSANSNESAGAAATMPARPNSNSTTPTSHAAGPIQSNTNATDTTNGASVPPAPPAVSGQNH